MKIPGCLASMGCLCWGHAKGAAADAPCDATERPTYDCPDPDCSDGEHERPEDCCRCHGDGSYDPGDIDGAATELVCDCPAGDDVLFLGPQAPWAKMTDVARYQAWKARRTA